MITGLWVVQIWVGIMVLMVLMLSSYIYIYNFVLFYLNWVKHVKTYIGNYSGLMSTKLPNNFHMYGLVKDLKFK